MRAVTRRVTTPAVLARALAKRRTRARPQRTERWAKLRDAAGRTFGRLTVVPTIGVISWLLPGLPLLLAGQFRPVPMLLISAPLLAALAVNVLHRVPASWPAELPGKARDRGWAPWFGLVGTAAAAAGFTVWQLAKNSPSVIATRSPGAAFQAGYWIAQHGSLPIPGSLAAFGGSHASMHLSSIGFYESGHSIVPAVAAGLPMLLAGGFWTSGIGGGAVVGPVLGGLAVLAFGGLVGRLVGLQWAPAGAVALAVTVPELYTSRDAFSETAVQVLLFGGLSLVIDALAKGQRATTEPQAVSTAVVAAAGPQDMAPTRPLARIAPSTVPRRIVAFARALTWRKLTSQVEGKITPERMLGGLGGLSLGLTSLLSLGSLVYLLPAIVVAGVLLAARRAVGIAFSVGLCVGCGYGLAAGYLLARPLAESLAPTLMTIGLYAAGLVVLTAGVLLLLHWSRARRITRAALSKRPLRWLPGLGSLVVLAAVAGLAARPYLQTVHGVLGRAQADYIAALQRMAGLRVDPTRLYSEDTLYWVSWYAGIATVLLACFGAAVLARRCLHALFTWTDTSGTRLNWALPLAVVLGGSAAVLWQPFTVPDQPWASRRLAPVVLPGAIVLAVWAAAWLARRARDRGAGTATVVLVSAFCMGAMLLPAAATSFGLGLTHSGVGGGLRPSSGGIAQRGVGSGQADAVRGMCAAIGRSSSVVIVDRRVAQLFTQVIRGICGVPVAWISPGAPAADVDAVLGGITRAGRRPVVLGAKPGQVAAFGGQPTLVMNLLTTQDPHELTQPGGAPWRAKYVVWMAVADTSATGI